MPLLFGFFDGVGVLVGFGSGAGLGSFADKKCGRTKKANTIRMASTLIAPMYFGHRFGLWEGGLAAVANKETMAATAVATRKRSAPSIATANMPVATTNVPINKKCVYRISSGDFQSLSRHHWNGSFLNPSPSWTRQS